MLFTKQFVVSVATTVWEQYQVQHPEANHTGAAMNELLCSWMALTKHLTKAASYKVCFARQCPDQTVTGFDAYIVTAYENTNITSNNKRMFLCTGLSQEPG